MNVVKAKCRHCGNSVPSDQFKLHYALKMMVCPNCFSGKTQKQQQEKKGVAEKPNKPVGWDQDDEYLQKYYSSKKVEKPQFRKITGSSHLECTCKNCKYAFKYDPFRKRPKNCPYCNEEIPRLNTFSML
jgi:Zn finger protein HypA/HybF involved in hydrogenase expression